MENYMVWSAFFMTAIFATQLWISINISVLLSKLEYFKDRQTLLSTEIRNELEDIERNTRGNIK